MKLLRKTNQIVIEGENYSLKYDQRKPMYIDLQFSNGIGCELFIPSGCDCDEKIDEIIQLAQPKIAETTDMIQVVFEGETTLWERVEYIFECGRDRVSYFYKVFGNGSLDNARFFESESEVPRLALTMGVGTILESKRCLLLAIGAEKATAISQTVEGPITAQVTASALQFHREVIVIVDEWAASRLERRKYYAEVERMELRGPTP